MRMTPFTIPTLSIDLFHSPKEPVLVFNRTRLYLAHTLKTYDPKLGFMLKGLNMNFCLGIDEVTPYKIFMLIDKRFSNTEVLETTAKLLYERNILKSYYPFINNDLVVLEFDIPEQAKHSYDMFMQSRYSEMYSPDELFNYFLYAPNNDYQHYGAKVLSKAPVLQQELSNFYDCEIDGELDSMLNLKNEILSL